MPGRLAGGDLMMTSVSADGEGAFGERGLAEVFLFVRFELARDEDDTPLPVDGFVFSFSI